MQDRSLSSRVALEGETAAASTSSLLLKDDEEQVGEEEEEEVVAADHTEEQPLEQEAKDQLGDPEENEIVKGPLRVTVSAPRPSIIVVTAPQESLADGLALPDSILEDPAWEGSPKRGEAAPRHTDREYETLSAAAKSDEPAGVVAVAVVAAEGDGTPNKSASCCAGEGTAAEDCSNKSSGEQEQREEAVVVEEDKKSVISGAADEGRVVHEPIFNNNEKTKVELSGDFVKCDEMKVEMNEDQFSNINNDTTTGTSSGKDLLSRIGAVVEDVIEDVINIATGTKADDIIKIENVSTLSSRGEEVTSTKEVEDAATEVKSIKEEDTSNEEETSREEEEVKSVPHLLLQPEEHDSSLLAVEKEVSPEPVAVEDEDKVVVSSVLSGIYAAAANTFLGGGEDGQENATTATGEGGQEKTTTTFTTATTFSASVEEKTTTSMYLAAEETTASLSRGESTSEEAQMPTSSTTITGDDISAVPLPDETLFIRSQSCTLDYCFGFGYILRKIFL